MLKRIWIFATAVTVLLSSVLSQAADHPAQMMVEETINEMLAVYQKDGERLKNDPEFLRSEVQELIVPNIDFETMTKLAVSKFWRRADADQRVALVEEFKTLLLNTYTSALSQYSGDAIQSESIQFDEFRPESRDDRAEVRSRFIQPTGDDVPVIYKLRDKGGWLIYDIEVNEISLVTSYRSAFSKEIEKGGVSGLIETLKERNAS